MYHKTVLTIVLCLAASAAADDVEHVPAIVIDSDMGIDDAVTLALALQSPQIQITGLVATEGVVGGDTAARFLGQMLTEFNRGDIPLHSPATNARKTPPAFRPFAEDTIGSVLRGTPQPACPFSSKAYLGPRGTRTIVLALGPLTNVAAALKDDRVRKSVAEILIQGSPEVGKNWNLGYDPEALAAVRGSGIPLHFIESGPAAAKPDAWRGPDIPGGQHTSIGEGVLARLFSAQGFRKHYTHGNFALFSDELVLLACINEDLFQAYRLASGEQGLRPRERDALLGLFTSILSDGRQAKVRVVFAGGSLPDDILQPDVRARKAEMLARNGETEWFAQLLMNELHEHLGSYSILGVKMGLRAAELLNAPQHGMRVVSHSAAQPPVSCLNDGVIVATGSTPGRALFRHEPGPVGATRVCFSFNGRKISLKVKDEYRRKVQASIDELRKTHTLEDAEYWDGVRKASLDVWEKWHRRDLFEITEEQTDPPTRATVANE